MIEKLEDDLIIFRNINSKNKKIVSNHCNVANSNMPSHALLNQGDSRHKLREFVTKEGTDFEYWKNI